MEAEHHLQENSMIPPPPSFHNVKFDLIEGHYFKFWEKVSWLILFFNTKLSDLIITLTYVLLDTFCPCFYFESVKENVT